MKKQLVEAGNVDAYICKETGTLYLDGTLLLTPGAKDELSRRGVAVAYGPRPGTACCPPGCTCPACCAGGVCPPGCTCPACCASGHCPPGCTCAGCAGGAYDAETERLMLAVAVVLRDEFGVKDLGTLKETSCKVAKAMRGNM